MTYTPYLALAAIVIVVLRPPPAAALPSHTHLRRITEQSESTSISATTIIGIVVCALSFMILVSTFLCFGRVRNATVWVCTDVRPALRRETRGLWTRLVGVCRRPPRAAAAAAAHGRGDGRRPHVLPPIATAHSALRVAAGPRAPPHATVTREVRLPKPSHAHVGAAAADAAASQQSRVEGCHPALVPCD